MGWLATDKLFKLVTGMLAASLVISNPQPLIAQNLVADPGFEEYSSLPCRQNNSFIQDLLKHWIQPLPTSTDYWNSQSDISCELNPKAIDRFPRSGTGMIGMITAAFYNSFPIEYKEYIETKLISSLKTGKLYYGEFYGHSKSVKEYDRLKANNLGLAFSESLVYDLNDKSPDHLFLPAKIKAKDVVEANEWKKISGCFLADKPYQYVLIGSFDSISSTIVRGDVSNVNESYAYYFIDDVNVRELLYDVSALSTSATLCGNQAYVELNAFVEGATGYTWEDGSNEPVIKVSTKSSKNYTVTISFNECAYTHNFYVDYIPDIVLGRDTLICSDEKLELKPIHPLKTYFWSDGTDDSIKYISSPGIYTVSVPSDECIIRDSIEVSVIDCPGFIPNVLTPNGDEYNQKLVFENIENPAWSLQILNRWGKQVYFSARYENNWDSGSVASGVYYYRLHSKNLNKVVKGWLHILR